MLHKNEYLVFYLHLSDDWLASEYRRAAERIDADAAAELVSMQAINR